MLYDDINRAVAFCGGPFEGICTPSEMADWLKIDDSTIRRAIADGRLMIGHDCIKVGKQWLLAPPAWDVIDPTGGAQQLDWLIQSCKAAIDRRCPITTAQGT